MSEQITPEQLTKIQQYSDEKRADFFIKEAVQHNKIWILTDEHGCVMLNTEDEDCVPVWPNEAFAESWANNEWQHCKPEAISLNKWFSRWTSGLIEDDIAIVVFPSDAEQGMVYDPEDVEQRLKAAQKKKHT
mgnify:CR=1 FL=1